MFRKITSAILALMLLAMPAFGQAEVTAGITNKAEGLELPPDAVVNYDEGFVSVEAKCAGQVKWLVISSVKVKYRVIAASNSIVISIPPKPGTVISVVAVGLVGGKDLTEFCRTNITVGGAPTPTPPNPNPPIPNPTPNPNGGPWHFTFVLNYDNMTTELATLLNSAVLREALEKNGTPRIYDSRSAAVKERNLLPYLQQAGGQTVFIIQQNDGLVKYAKPIPRTEAEVMQIVNQITGGR